MHCAKASATQDLKIYLIYLSIKLTLKDTLINMLAWRKLFNKPKLEDGSLLSLFYYCDIAVNHQMQELNTLMRINPDNLDRRSVLIRLLKEAQHNLMNVIMSIADHVIPDKRVSRDFRAKYPDDVLLDQISGPIWFGAECIAAGSHIANHEVESTELRPYATHLSKVITKVRQALRQQSYVNRVEYPQKIKDMLVMFDELWADFEFKYVSLMCHVKTESQYYHQQEVVVLFSESALRAIKKKNLSYDMIEMMDPSVMFAIPRLAILCGLVVYPEGPLNPSKPSKEMPHCFRAYKQLLFRIKELLGHLNQEQLDTLEQALCSAEGLGTLERSKLKAAATQKTEQNGSGANAGSHSHSNSRSSSEITPVTESNSSATATLSTTPSRRPLSAHVHPSPPPHVSIETGHILATPSSQPQRRHSYNLDSRDPNTTVFEPHPVPGVVLPPDTSISVVGVAHEEGVVLEEVEPFPRLGINQPIDNVLPSAQLPLPTPLHTLQPDRSASASSLLLPSSSNTPPTLKESVSAVEKSPKPSKKSKPKGLAGFPSVEDLLHRLFLGISGVADQLQTNHAKDLRVILKNVFAVCQSETEDNEVVSCPKETSQTKYSSVNELEPCTPEPQSPLLTASQRFNFPTESLTIEQGPSWIPDSDSPICSSCKERFSWKRRRHHCRNCGNVVCAKCSPNELPLFQYGIRKPVRVCTNCYISQLSDFSHTVTGIAGQPLHVV